MTADARTSADSTTRARGSVAPEVEQAIVADLATGNYSTREVAERNGVGRSTVSKYGRAAGVTTVRATQAAQAAATTKATARERRTVLALETVDRAAALLHNLSGMVPLHVVDRDGQVHTVLVDPDPKAKLDLSRAYNTLVGAHMALDRHDAEENNTGGSDVDAWLNAMTEDQRVTGATSLVLQLGSGLRAAAAAGLLDGPGVIPVPESPDGPDP